MQVSKEYKVGLLVLLGGLVLFIGINVLKTGVFTGGRNEYYAVFDKSNGLVEGNEVQLNGVKIGEVLEVKLHPKNPMMVLARFTIEKEEIKIPKTSQAWMISTDILGTKCIDIKIDKSDTASAELLQNGDTLNSIMELTLEEEFDAHIEPLKVKTEELIGSVEGIIVDVKSFWDTSGAYTIGESIYEAREAIGTYLVLARNLTDVVNRETQSVSRIVTNINMVKDSAILRNMDDIKRLSLTISEVSGDYKNSGLLVEMSALQATMKDFDQNITAMKNGNGDVGKFLYTTAFKDALKETKSSADVLMKNLSEDPMKFIGLSILGKKIMGLQLTKEEEEILKKWLSE